MMVMKSLVVVSSYHHRNTEKIAQVFADVFDARIATPRQVIPGELQACDLVGFGSGIYGGKHHDDLLELADRLPAVTGGKAFLFSTCGIPATGLNHEVIHKNHAALRGKMQSKGYIIIGEFGCPGWNTNSFLRLFGGINKGRPDADDLRHAKEFAEKLKTDYSSG